MNYRLEMKNITKAFNGVKALNNVSFKVKNGSIHALVGENGAGKSTLMKCLFGIHSPDDGSIYIDGKQIKISNSKKALDNGISMIHQELNPIPDMTVSDNIWLGRHVTNGIVVDEKLMYKKTKELLSDLEFDIKPNALAKTLSVSQLQAIEIAKAISYDSKIIIMDEPTSSLTLSETKHLFKIMNKLKERGISIIYISHKLEEIFEIFDELSVMRDGEYIGTWCVNDINIDFLIEKMVGRSMEERYPPSENEIEDGIDNTILRIQNFTSKNPRSFKNISFDLKCGEILGIGGLVGAQRTELVESIFGLRKLETGDIYLYNQKITCKSPIDAIKNGISLLTEDRRSTGIISMLSILDNILIASYDKFFSKFGLVKEKEGLLKVKEVCNNMNVKMSSILLEIQKLSGGNQQKVLIGRWLLTKSNILILDEPTRGVDVSAKYEIYKIMRKLVKKGNSIIMVSSEMPELIGMSDRVLVMCNGRITGILDKENLTQTEIMRLSTKFS